MAEALQDERATCLKKIVIFENLGSEHVPK